MRVTAAEFRQQAAKPSTVRGEVRAFFENVVLHHSGDECLLWPYTKMRTGYGTIRIDGTTRLAHRLACQSANGEPPTSQHEAAHLCGNAQCVNKQHLSWKTHADNQMDRVIHGTSNRGQRHGVSKLTESQVLQIRSLRGSLTQKEIAARFDVDRQHVGKILRRELWGWL